MSRALPGIFSGLFAVIGGVAIGACTPEPDPEPRPFEDAWRLELDLPFPYLDAAGTTARIKSLTIGGREEDDNFANRGHVIVQFDPAGTAADGRIRVEMRRYTMARTAEEAADVFAALQLWAAKGRVVPEPAPEDSCLTTWQDACQVRVAYRGLVQLARAGADLRVTLPAAYRHLLTVVTEDNVAESDYQRRGDVCVEGLDASADIQVGSGRVFVVLDPATTPMPQCTLKPGAVEDCVSHEDGAWSSACRCVAEMGDFGRVRVTSHDGAAVTATVDVPRGLWVNAALVNEGPEQMRGSDPPCADASPMGTRCDSCVAIEGYVPDPNLGPPETRTPWIDLGVAARPSGAANPSSGFLVNLVSKRCDAVRYTPVPEAFVGEDLEAQPIEERGNLHVCHDCLRTTGCAGLLTHP